MMLMICHLQTCDLTEAGLCDRYQHGTKADELYEGAKKLEVTATLDLGDAGVHDVAFYHLHQKHVDFVFVDHPVYHRPGL